MIKIKIANLAIGIENRFSHIEMMAKDYLSEDEPVFTVSVTDSEIEEERSISATDCQDGYYESIVAYRKIAEKLPEYDAFVFHGSVIEMNGNAYIITAHSGVGKTTHTRLWLSEFPGEASILNGDKPIVRIIDGKAYACGTPWQGKEDYGKNEILPIKGIAFLTRASDNRAYVILPGEAVTRFMSQIYLPKQNRMMLLKTMQLADKVIKEIKLVHLECNMQPEAAHVCRAAFRQDTK